MAILKNCCCCLNLRNGSILTGIYTTILASVYLLIAISTLVGSGNQEGVIVSTIIRLLLYLGLLIVSIILIVGALKDKMGFYIPWLIFMPIYIIFQLITLIVMVIYGGINSWFSVLNIILFILFTIFNIYCFLCVLSQYQELKEGRGTADYYAQLRAAQGRPVVVTTTTSTQKA